MKPLRFLGTLALFFSVALFLSVSACTTEETAPSGLLTFSAKLVKPLNEVDLEARLKAELIRRYERDHERSAYWGYPQIGIAADTGMTGNSTTGSKGGEAGPSGTTASGSGGATAYSETNVQEKGVDEGDLVKTDGAFIYLVRGTHFFILQANPADQTDIVSDINIKEQVSELYQIGNRVLLVTAPIYGYMDSGAASAESGIAVMPSRPATRIHCYDVTTKATPTLAASFDFPGSLRGSRRINNTVYIVTDHYVDLPSPAYPSDYLKPGEYDQKAWAAASDQAFEENTMRILALSLDELLPTYSTAIYSGVTSSVTTTSPAVGASDIYFPEFGNGTDLSLVFSLDLGSTVPTVDSTAVFSSWGGIYMSPDSLYLTSDNNWQWIEPMVDAAQPQSNPEPRTAVHKFALSATEKPAYRGSGMVNGWLNNRFSLSDYQGYLRIGTTRGGWWGEGRSNQLTVLGEANGSLVTKGTITGLAPGEQIYSMRYDGTRGYMVTFRQTDPLFTLDLSDPANPRKTGELKVNGFATYIHLVGDDRLLTIGPEADSTGRMTGSNKLQLFDVSNLSSPTLLSTHDLGAGWSNAVYDPHAFLYYEPLGILTIPYYNYSYGVDAKTSYSSGLSVFDIGRSSISQRGIITAPTVTTGYGDAYIDTVDRSVIIGNTIYALAHRSVTAAGAEQLNTLKTVALPESYEYYYYTYAGGGGTGVAEAGAAPAVK